MKKLQVPDTSRNTNSAGFSHQAVCSFLKIPDEASSPNIRLIPLPSTPKLKWLWGFFPSNSSHFSLVKTCCFLDILLKCWHCQNEVNLTIWYFLLDHSRLSRGYSSVHEDWEAQNVSWKTASSLLSWRIFASVTSPHWQLPFSSFVLHCSQSWGVEGCAGVFSYMYMGYCVQFSHQCHLSILLPLTYSTISFSPFVSLMPLQLAWAVGCFGWDARD